MSVLESANALSRDIIDLIKMHQSNMGTRPPALSWWLLPM
jgi:hypothetical protein